MGESSGQEPEQKIDLSSEPPIDEEDTKKVLPVENPKDLITLPSGKQVIISTDRVIAEYKAAAPHNYKESTDKTKK